MRISNSMLYAAGSAQINDLQAQLLQSQEEISTGKSFLTPADNPVAAAAALVVTQTQADNTQFAANRLSATNSLSQEESTLQGVTNLIQNAQTAIVSAGNGSYTPQERQSVATSLQATFNQLIGLANAQDGNGNYLFSGYRSSSLPFSVNAVGAQYNGDQGQTSVQVGVSQQMALSDSGDSVFQNNITGNGTFTTAATSTNVGTGVVSGGSVANAALLTGDNYVMTFKGIQTAASAPNVGTGVISPGTIVTASALNGDTYDLNFHVAAGVTTYDVVDATTAVTVSSGNAYSAGQSIIAGGAQFSVSGNPANGDQFTVVNNPTTYTISDTTNPLSATIPPPNQPYLAGQSITFDGLQFNVSGTPANADTFTINPSTKQSVFTTLTNLINLLSSPPGAGATSTANIANGLNTAGNNLANALNNILTVRSSVGARLNELTSLDTVGSSLNLQYSTTLSGLQDVNYAKVISQFSQEQTTLTAAQQSFVKISNLSLFNYIA